VLDAHDLRIDVFRARGPTGPEQHAVRVTHSPTGIEVLRQDGATVEEDRREAMAELEHRLRDADTF